MTKYVATINIPGYLPMDDDPPVFESTQEAWNYLADERDRAIDEVWKEGDPETDAACIDLLYRSERDDYGTGSVTGPTPGYEGEHDLGLAYCVTEVEE